MRSAEEIASESANGIPRPFGHAQTILVGSAPQIRGTAVIIATRGRPGIVKQLVDRLAEQTVPPEHVFVIGSRADDVTGLRSYQRLTVETGRTGSALQRNDGLALAGAWFSYIVFFDDDFIPSRFWIERMIRLFEKRPDIAGITGTVLADGAKTVGIRPEDGLALVARRDARPLAGERVYEDFRYGFNVGCNMAFRHSAIADITFDERLPLYAWLEDSDFRAQAARKGPFVRAEALWGVHLGHKQGRGRGITLGYSQVANAVYLARKGTVPLSFLVSQLAKNLVSNILHAIRPEPFIDRRGRLRGNMIALGDAVRGRIDPRRILKL